MVVKAKLKIVLNANNVIVAESEDPALWQEVFAAINSNNANVDLGTGVQESKISPPPSVNKKVITGNTEVDKFAAEIGVAKDLIISACTPTNETPYIHLDKHHWEALKKNTPERGNKAVNAVVLASTALTIWKDTAKLGNVAITELSSVLETIGLTPKNTNRSITNCEWLQLRSGSIYINPAQTSKAIKVMSAYCNKVSPWD